LLKQLWIIASANGRIVTAEIRIDHAPYAADRINRCLQTAQRDLKQPRECEHDWLQKVDGTIC
jgi:hypothetical protein